MERYLKRKGRWFVSYREYLDYKKDKIHEGKFYNISHIIQEGIKLLQESELKKS